MTCKNCGAEIGNYVSFCTFCGKPVGNPAVDLNKPAQQEASAPPPGYSDPEIIADREPFQQPEFGQVPVFNRSSTSWQNSHSGNIPGAMLATEPQLNGSTWREIKQMGHIIGVDGRNYGIGWLKFIVYVQLFATAAIALYNAILFFFGLFYSGDPELLYAYIPGLKTLDMTMGTFYLLLGGMAVFVRFMLTGLRKYAPWMYLGICLCSLLFSVIYTCVLAGLLGVSFLEVFKASDLVSLLFITAMIVVNFVYFRHRMNAFVN